MRAVIQRVKKASVKIPEKALERSIGKGLLVLLAIKNGDSFEDVKWLTNKILNLRIFPDSNDKMNISVQDYGGEILIVSNFTLYGDVNRGFRPSFTDSADPTTAKRLYETFVEHIKTISKVNISTGEFGEMMDVELINDGPVTIIIDT
ncbi:MAG: D-aminoacyl-tRNA deacylase [Ignavibacteria bacterium]|nr:D-aminoacyl-tRNA deacylase [Ignavibacteria bacterium]